MKLMRVWWSAIFAMAMTFFTGAAMAFTAPTAGDFGYDFYDIVIIKMLGGPIGWVGAGILLVWGVSMIMRQWLVSVVCILGATAIIKITTILTSLGAMIP